MIQLVSYEYLKQEDISDPLKKPDLEIVYLNHPYRNLQPGFYIFNRNQSASADFYDYAIGEFKNPRQALRYFRNIHCVD